MIKYIYHSINEEIKIENEKNALYIYNDKDYEQFLENLFIINNIVLKEEKEILLFYSLLNKKTKDFFNITDYFSCIDIAYNYYELIDKLYNNNINKENINCENKLGINVIYEIHNKMIEYANTNNIVPRYLKYYNYKINNNFLKSYNKIIIINKFDITKKEKEILNNLNIDVIFHLYINKNDYDENNNLLMNISYEYNDNKNIQALKFRNKELLKIYLTQYLSEQKDKNICINDLNTDAEFYSNINQNLLYCNYRICFNNSKSYKILKYLYNILKEKKLIYPLYEAFLDVDFTDFFSIKKEDIITVKKALYNSVKYIDIFNIEYNLNKIVENLANKYLDESDILLEAYTEILSIKDFSFYKVIKSEKDLLLIFIKYLDEKYYKLTLKDSKFSISNIDEEKSDNLIMLNLQEDILKNNKIFILTPKERISIGIKNQQDYKYQKYYKYIRKLILSNNILLLYVENQEEDINIFSIFNEYIHKQNVKVLEYEFSTNDILNFNEYIYEIKKYEYNNKFLTKYDTLSITKEDLSNISINGYNFILLFESELELYLKTLLDKKSIKNFEYKFRSIDKNIIGNIIHKIFEYSIKEEKYTMNELIDIKDRVLLEYENYIIKDYLYIYKKLLFDEVLSDIHKYLNEIKSKKPLTEVEVKMQYNEINVSFRQDLIYYNKDGSINIVDIKTGNVIKDISNDDKRYQLIAYTVFNNILGNKVLNASFYYPFENNHKINIPLSCLISEDFLDSKLNEIKNFEDIKTLQVIKKAKMFGFDNILRGKDYATD